MNCLCFIGRFLLILQAKPFNWVCLCRDDYMLHVLSRWGIVFLYFNLMLNVHCLSGQRWLLREADDTFGWWCELSSVCCCGLVNWLFWEWTLFKFSKWVRASRLPWRFVGRWRRHRTVGFMSSIGHHHCCVGIEVDAMMLVHRNWCGGSVRRGGSRRDGRQTAAAARELGAGLQTERGTHKIALDWLRNNYIFNIQTIFYL